MSISSISSLSTQTMLGLDNASTSLSSSSAKASATGQIKEALTKAVPEGGNTSDSLYSALVSLSSQESSDPNSLSLYDAKGLLMRVKSSLMQNNPLYATGSESAQASDFSGAYSNTASEGSTSELGSKVEALLEKYTGKDAATQTVSQAETNPGSTASHKAVKDKA